MRSDHPGNHSSLFLRGPWGDDGVLKKEEAARGRSRRSRSPKLKGTIHDIVTADAVLIEDRATINPKISAPIRRSSTGRSRQQGQLLASSRIAT
jgi:hypothetical protein